MAGVVSADVPRALSPFVAGIHYLQSDAESDALAIERILPSGSLHLLVNLDEDEIRTYHGDESILVRRLRGRGEPDRALGCAAPLVAHGVPVSEVASRVGLLPRTLVRRFRASVGLTPKRYSRVRRLQRVIASIGYAQNADWCDLAATSGYVDQAHLIHDFRALAGITPTAYRPRSESERNHVPVARD